MILLDGFRTVHCPVTLLLPGSAHHGTPFVLEVPFLSCVQTVSQPD